MAASARRSASVASAVSCGMATEPKAVETANPSPLSDSAAQAASSTACWRVALAITQNSSPPSR